MYNVPLQPIQFTANNLVRTHTCACGACCGLQHLRGHEVDLSVVCGLDTAFDPQHFSNCVLVSMADLKFLPGLPEVCGHLNDQVHKYTKKGLWCAQM